MKWTGPKKFFPPFGEFSEGDDLSHLPISAQQALVEMGCAIEEAAPHSAPVVPDFADEE